MSVEWKEKQRKKREGAKRGSDEDEKVLVKDDEIRNR
jgi:hypothetical protein